MTYSANMALEQQRMLFGRELHCGCHCTAQATSALEKFGGSCVDEVTGWMRSVTPVWACKLSRRGVKLSKTYLVSFRVIAERICGSDAVL